MRIPRPTTPSAFLALFLSFSGAAAACGGGNATGPGPQPPALAGDDAGAPGASASATTPMPTTSTASTAPTTSATPTASTATKPPPELKPIVATALAAYLKAIGLDVKKLPPLGKLDPQKLRKVMDLFTKSLGGVECTMCHVKSDFKAATPNKNVAGHMWDEFVRRYETTDSKPIFCDSCHQGRVDLLNRGDRKALAKYMSDVYVDGIKLKDGKDHDCATCHGDITAPPFLDAKWAKSWKSQ